MNRRAALLAGLAAGLSAAAGASPCAAAAATEAEALARASGRGRRLYAYDQAAWVSTDELVKHAPDPQALGVAGYVVEPLPDGTLRAIYYRMEGETPRAVFTADVRGRAVASSRLFAAGEDASLSPLAARLVKAAATARADAIRRKLAPCVDAAFNRVVLPPEAPEAPTPVYLLTPQIREGEFPFGGHYEIDVAADGSIAASRAFTKSCLPLSTRDVPDGGQTAEMYVTHLLDPTPTEIHVYLSLWMGLPVAVSTGPKRVWRVDGDRISLVEGDKPEK